MSDTRTTSAKAEDIVAALESLGSVQVISKAETPKEMETGFPDTVTLMFRMRTDSSDLWLSQRSVFLRELSNTAAYQHVLCCTKYFWMKGHRDPGEYFVEVLSIQDSPPVLGQVLHCLEITRKAQVSVPTNAIQIGGGEGRVNGIRVHSVDPKKGMGAGGSQMDKRELPHL